MKKFNEMWTNEEINSYLSKNNILILFKNSSNKYTMNIYGDISDDQKKQLSVFFRNMFGSHTGTDMIFDKINEIAIKWYNKIRL